MLYQLFSTFFKIGCFTIGGGYAMVPVIQREIVATNAATYVGYKMAGIPGALAAVFATALPSFLIILVIAVFFTSIKDNIMVQHIFSGVRPAVVSLIVYAVIKLAKAIGFKAKNIIISVGTLLGMIFLNIHPFIAVTASGIIGFFFFREEEKEQ